MTYVSPCRALRDVHARRGDFDSPLLGGEFAHAALDAADADLNTGEVRPTRIGADDRSESGNDVRQTEQAMSATDRSWTVACLAGDGVGPELMGEASRVLAAVARLHALRIDDVHLPFGGEALDALRPPAAALDARGLSRRRRDPRLLARRPRARRRQGRPRPRLARLARAQPAPRRPARRRAGRPGTDELAIARAFEIAAARRARLTSVGFTAEWNELVTLEADGWDGLDVELLTLARRAHALPRPPRDGRPGRRARPPRRRDRRRCRAPRRQPAHGRERLALADGARASSRPRCATTTRSPASASRTRPDAARRLAAARRGPRPAFRRTHARTGRHGRRGTHGDDRHTQFHRRGDRGASRRAYRHRALRGGMAMTRMYGSDAILRSLEAEGVDVMFGIPGGATGVLAPDRITPGDRRNRHHHADGEPVREDDQGLRTAAARRRCVGLGRTGRAVGGRVIDGRHEGACGQRCAAAVRIGGPAVVDVRPRGHSDRRRRRGGAVGGGVGRRAGGRERSGERGAADRHRRARSSWSRGAIPRDAAS